jgi:hypothetical protein
MPYFPLFGKKSWFETDGQFLFKASKTLSRSILRKLAFTALPKQISDISQILIIS